MDVGQAAERHQEHGGRQQVSRGEPAQPHGAGGEAAADHRDGDVHRGDHERRQERTERGDKQDDSFVGGAGF